MLDSDCAQVNTPALYSLPIKVVSNRAKAGYENITLLKTSPEL